MIPYFDLLLLISTSMILTRSIGDTALSHDEDIDAMLFQKVRLVRSSQVSCQGDRGLSSQICIQRWKAMI
jgi:hypothetical protein